LTSSGSTASTEGAWTSPGGNNPARPFTAPTWTRRASGEPWRRPTGPVPRSRGISGCRR
jgi:hypothetical protein